MRSLGITLLIIVFAVSGCKKQEIKTREERKSLPNVDIAVLKNENIQDYFSLTGRTEAWEDVIIVSETGGTVEEVNVNEGDSVLKGQNLLQIDEAMAKASLNQVKALAALAEAEYKREKTLFDEGLSSESQLDSLKAEFEIRTADLKLQEIRYKKSVITSPVKGVLTYMEIEKGESALPGSMVARVVNIDKIKVIVEVPEKDINSVKQNDQVEISISSMGDKKVSGKIYFISTVSVGPGRTYPVKIIVDNPEHQIKPGMIVRVSFKKPLKENSLLIPQESLMVSEGRKWVFIVNGNKAVEKEVETGIYTEREVEITEGLSAGDLLITNGHESLVDGETIRYEKKAE